MNIIEIYEQELLASEKEKVFTEIELNCEERTVVRVMFKGLEVGRLMLSVKNMEFNPLYGFKLDLRARNITPMK